VWQQVIVMKIHRLKGRVLFGIALIRAKLANARKSNWQSDSFVPQSVRVVATLGSDVAICR
jgi:hypothetical protein